MAKTKTKNKAMSLREYARRRGVTAEAVSKAIMAGRLAESVVRVKGQPKISDPKLADREWEANTRPRVDLPPPTQESDEPAPAADDQNPPDYYVSRAKREAAAARREAALAELAELDVAERRGELVDANEMAEKFVEVVTVAKTKLLGVPARVKQRLPHVATEDIRLIDELVREALEDLADGEGDREEDEDGE
jgi:hypothetical protein